jgi:hypothetical protein
VAYQIEVSFEVDGNDAVPLILGHIENHTIAEDSGWVDENVQTSKGVNRRLNDAKGAFRVRD